jgi:two-component system OmpR family response regulator
VVRKALIVEDERDTGELLAEIVRRRGFESTLLLEGKPAVPWIRQHRPDLVLLDLMLPDRDGYEICEDLKLDRQTNLIPIIMVTARDLPRDRLRGLQVGANAYLTKPFSVEQLENAMHEVLVWREKLQRSGTAGEVHFQLNSATQYLEELNHLLASLFLFSGLTEHQVRELTMAVRELGTNAIEWGHQKQEQRIVTVTYRIDSAKVTIVIRDTGPGFDPKNLPHAARVDDPLGHLPVRETLGIREGGFGILMARGLVDELHYNQAGNEACLVKYFAAPPTNGNSVSSPAP